MRRVVITGLGCVSALGHDAETHWRAARDARCGIGPMRSVDTDPLRTKIAAEVWDFDPAQHFDERRAESLDRFSHFAVVAARQAVQESGLEFTGSLADRTGVVFGTGIGGAGTIDRTSRRIYGDGNRRVHPDTIPRLMPSAAASHVTMEFGITGPAFAVTSACSSASHAVGAALDLIRSGRADVAVAGGSEACLTYATLLSWQALRGVIAPEACRPFCLERRGMILGEGAGAVVLEEEAHARARGAAALAELAGWGMSADAQSVLEPSVEGAVKALALALTDARLAPDELDYVNAHGTGTRANDANETAALHRVLGPHARRVAVSSTKPAHGHALGAAGALELVITVRALQDGVLPPTLGYLTPDPDCDLDYVPNEARERPIRAALSNSFAFGGLNSVLALRRMD